jgi:hypothetical protein
MGPPHLRSLVLQTALVAIAMHAVTLQVLAAADYQETLVKDGRTLHVHISAEYEPEQRKNLIAWIDYISGTLREVYGHWPRQEWRVSITPASAADTDPIPWARVHREDVDNIEFFTAPQATTESLNRNWTGYHELAHLLIPYRGWGDTWFSEGLASLYQILLQARSGLLTEQQAWQKLYEGFMRGRADSQFNGQPLSAISAAMRENGSFMRVYWSGAWYFLATDIRLRQQSGGANSLDLALAKLNECCADERLSVPQMVNKLDTLNKVLLFQLLYDEVNASTEMPAFEKLFASLGVTIVDGVVNLQQEGPGAHLRRAIVQPKPL